MTAPVYTHVINRKQEGDILDVLERTEDGDPYLNDLVMVTEDGGRATMNIIVMLKQDPNFRKDFFENYNLWQIRNGDVPVYKVESWYYLPRLNLVRHQLLSGKVYSDQEIDDNVHQFFSQRHSESSYEYFSPKCSDSCHRERKDYSVAALALQSGELECNSDLQVIMCKKNFPMI